MSLSENHLLMLNILIFTDYLNDGDNVGQIVTRLESVLDQGLQINACRMNSDEWRFIINCIKKQHALLAYKVQNYNNDARFGKNMACFLDDTLKPQDIIIVFRGSPKNDEWHDNGSSCYKTETKKQIEAAEYVNSLPKSYGNNMTVTGHSKGGNKAQYVTVVTDRIGKCISFDGQGFSKEFVEKYSEKISEKSQLIKSISAAEDYVNSFLLPITEKRIFLETNINFVYHFIEYHKPNILLDESGELNPDKEQSKLSKKINKYCEYVLFNINSRKKHTNADKIVKIFEKMADIHRKLSRWFLQPAVYDAQRSLFRFRTVAFRRKTAVLFG